MFYLDFQKADCKNCYKCLRECPVKAIKVINHQAQIIESRCILCGKCTSVCPQNAKEITDETEKAKVLIMSGAPVYVSVAPSFIANYNGADIEALDRAVKRLGFAGAFLLIIFVCISKYPSVVFLSHKRNLLILTVTGVLMIIILLCLGMCRKKRTQTGLWAALFCLVAANMVSEGYTSTLERLTLRKDNAQYWGDLYDADVQKALAWLEEKDPEFYRVEKDFDVGSICMDSLAQGYRGVSTYNSTINRYILLI